ncbi:Uma2 family endonuclease [soil metagenome]|jgi:Uma2 family endonuclease
MTSMAVAQRMTVTEYLEHDDERRSNLVDGEIVVSEPRMLHQDVLGELFVALKLWVRAAPGRGQATLPIDVEVDAHNCFAPDVLWYRAGREPGRSLVRPQPLPDIAAEIRSPSTWRHDIGAKKTHYEQHGLAELWLVDTAADEIIVFRRSTQQATTFDVSAELARGDALTSPLLPGFTLALDELFGPA